MANKRKTTPFGVLVPIVTPCTRAGEPDLGGLGAVCDDMLAAGVDSFFVAGSTGRGPWFSRADRAKVCRAVADRLGGDRPLLAGCMAAGLPDMIDNARAMADAGAMFAVATAPVYFKYSAADLEAIFLAFADRSPVPVVVYDIPDLVASGIDTRTLSALASHPNIAGFKDSSANYVQFVKLLDALKSVPGFHLLQGKEPYLKDSLAAGASGFVVSLLHVDPRPFVALARAVRAGDTATADRLQAAILKVFDLINECFKQRPESSTLFHFLNEALSLRGVRVNLRLAYEADCPDLIAQRARAAVGVLAETC